MNNPKKIQYQGGGTTKINKKSQFIYDNIVVETQKNLNKSILPINNKIYLNFSINEATYYLTFCTIRTKKGRPDTI